MNIWEGKRSQGLRSIELRAAVFVLCSYWVWRPRVQRKYVQYIDINKGVFLLLFVRPSTYVM